MAHTKAAGSRANQGGNVSGKRLGVKKYGGEMVKTGMIILKQRGTKVFPGKNTFMARDFTIHAHADGVVTFRQGAGIRRGSKVVDVLPVAAKAEINTAEKTVKESVKMPVAKATKKASK